MSKETVLVTGYKEQNFTVTEKGIEKTIDMVKISYLTAFSGLDAVGFLPIQVIFNDIPKKVILGQVVKAPGIYELESAMVPGKNNKPTSTVVGFTFIKDVDLKPLFKVS